MTGREFLAKIEGYYGKYQPVVREVVIGWLNKNKPDLDGLFMGLVQEHSNQFKTPPDVAILHKVWSGMKPTVPEFKALPEPDEELIKINWDEIGKMCLKGVDHEL